MLIEFVRHERGLCRETDFELSSSWLTPTSYASAVMCLEDIPTIGNGVAIKASSIAGETHHQQAAAAATTTTST
jgi:hypothetical protein